MTHWSSTSAGKEKKFLEHYILHSLSQTPQTGYDLIKEIERKTDGKWVPSKGLIYPLLDELEKNNLIEIHEFGERSKKIYKITEKGQSELNSLKKRHEEMQERFDTIRKLFLETFVPQDERETAELFYLLRKKVMESPDRKEIMVRLQKFVEELP